MPNTKLSSYVSAVPPESAVLKSLFIGGNYIVATQGTAEDPQGVIVGPDSLVGRLGSNWISALDATDVKTILDFDVSARSAVGSAMDSLTIFTPAVNDNAAYSLDLSTLPDVGGPELFAGNIIVSTNVSGGGNRGIFAIRAATSSAFCVAIAATGITATTGILTGTTGSDGTVTVSTHTNKHIYIENRLGFACNFSLTLNAVVF